MATDSVALKQQAGMLDGGSARAELSGFADPTGDAAKNLELAKQRAITVRDALVAAGVPTERVDLVKPQEVVVGSGSDVDARRVDIVLR